MIFYKPHYFKSSNTTIHAINLLLYKININVLKIGPDQLVGPLTGHKTSLVQCKKPFFDRIGQEPDELKVKPVNRSLPQFFFFFKLKRRRFDAFYIETTLFCLELESL